MNKEDLENKICKYRELTFIALQKVEVKKDISNSDYKKAKKLLDMASSYYSDAKYFEEKGLKLTSLAAYSYAHALIDAGVMIGLLDGKNDSTLFVLP